MKSEIIFGNNALLCIKTKKLADYMLMNISTIGDYNNLMEITTDISNSNITMIEFITLDVDSNMKKGKIELPNKDKLKRLNSPFYMDNDENNNFKFYFDENEINVVIDDSLNIDSYYINDRVEYYYAGFKLTNIKISNLSKSEYAILESIKNSSYQVNSGNIIKMWGKYVKDVLKNNVNLIRYFEASIMKNIRLTIKSQAQKREKLWIGVDDEKGAESRASSRALLAVWMRNVRLVEKLYQRSVRRRSAGQVFWRHER